MTETRRLVMQTRFGGPDAPDDEVGDCWAACLATMLGIDIGEVPEALRLEADGVKRWDCYLEFLAGFNLRPLTWNFDAYGDRMIDVFWEAAGDALIHVIGTSPRGDWNHGVVYRAGRLFHDPHPSGDGILRLTHVEFWLPIDPAKLNRATRRKT